MKQYLSFSGYVVQSKLPSGMQLKGSHKTIIIEAEAIGTYAG